MDKVSYALGLGIGQQLLQMGASELDIDDFAAAIKDVIAGNELKVQHREAQQIVQNYFAEQEKRLNAQRAEQGKVHKEAGEKYLAENAKKEGVITLPSGLQYQVLKPGNGKKPTAKDTVMCHYEGFLIAASLPRSPCSKSLPVGPRACSSCKKVPSTASSFPIAWPTARAEPVHPSPPSQPSSSMSS